MVDSYRREAVDRGAEDLGEAGHRMNELQLTEHLLWTCSDLLLALGCGNAEANPNDLFRR